MNRTQFRFMNIRLLLMIALGFFLQACAAGLAKIEGPDLPLEKNTVSLDRDVYFQVCVPPKSRGVQPKLVSKMKSVLERDFSIVAHTQAPIGDKPYLHFLIIPQETENLYVPFVFPAMFSFSVIPGYTVDRTKINIQFSARDASGEIIQGSYAYEYRIRWFVWLPFIVYPDIFMVFGSGGYRDEDKILYRGPELVLNRFILDVSERLRQRTNDARPSVSLKELRCP